MTTPSSMPRDADNAQDSAQDSAQTESVMVPTYQPLHQVIATLDLDILQELDRFRSWQQAQRSLSQPAAPVVPEEDLPPSPSANYADYGTRPPYLQPQDVVEDLDIEERGKRPPGVFSPLSILLLWLFSCAGVGLGLWWLTSPGDPNRTIANQPVAEPEGTLSLNLGSLKPKLGDKMASRPINVANIPLISIEPFLQGFGERLDQSDLLPFVKAELRPQDVQIVALLDLLPPPPPTPEPTPIPEPTLSLPNPTDNPQIAQNPNVSPELLPSPDPGSVASATRPRQVPLQSTPNVDSLGAARGEGTFLVLMTYQGEETLTRARQVSSGAFVKEIGGIKYVQLASFQQLEYARYMAENLRQQGIPIVISQL